MSRPKIIFTPTYEESLRGIEDFIYRSSQDLVALEAFADEHDRVLTFILENPTTPAVHPATGDQSWPFGEGRYRLFFKYLSRGKEKANLFDPSNRQPTSKHRHLSRQQNADL